MEEIQDLSKQIDFNNLTYRYNGNTGYISTCTRPMATTNFLFGYQKYHIFPQICIFLPSLFLHGTE